MVFSSHGGESLMIEVSYSITIEALSSLGSEYGTARCEASVGSKVRK